MQELDQEKDTKHIQELELEKVRKKYTRIGIRKGT